jgi:RHS repeat-associated protein
VDGLGSTVNLCDEDGELVGEYTYDAYGNVRAQTGTETEFSFAGEQSDPNGLDFLRARYYDPEIGRFLSGDPLGGGYGYAAGNPVNLVDPSGLWTICNQWDSAATLATGEHVCAVSQEVDTVYTSQVVLNAEAGDWGSPIDVDDWKDGDWACSQVCVSQIDLVPDSLKDDLRRSGQTSNLYNGTWESIMVQT